jgi:UDP-N-acetylmuramate--alanine ligase
MNIYPARELPIDGVSSELIMKDVSCPAMLVSCEQIEQKLADTPVQVLLTLGAGDIDRIVPIVKEALLNKTL